MKPSQLRILLLTSAFLATTFGITCFSCAGAANSACHLKPYELSAAVYCGSNDVCATFIQIYQDGREIHHVNKGCASNMIPMAKGDWNSCKTDSSHFIECSRTCTADNCNQNLTFVPPGWNQRGDPTNTQGSTFKKNSSTLLSTSVLNTILLAFFLILFYYF